MKPFRAALLVLAAGIPGILAAEQDWAAKLTRTAGTFAPLPSVRLEYSFGWSNVLEAANASARIERTSNGYRARVSGGTLGLARALWPLDAQHSATTGGQAETKFAQIERYRRRTIDTQVRFDAAGLERRRSTSDEKTPARWKRVEFAPMFDVIGGVLFVRSQPLRVGDTVSLVGFPGDSPYFVTVRVERRETVRAMDRDWPALRLRMDVSKLEVKNKRPAEAVRYAKFRSGTFWVSDDDLRVPLRAEVNVMVGFVYGELTKLERL